MIASMTAYGRTEESGDVGHVIWEIRSVNHRYLEINTRLPEEVRMLESTIREHITKRIKRGKIDCNLRYEPNDDTDAGLSLNAELIAALIKSTQQVQSSLPESGTINPLDVLRWPGVINRATPDPEKIGGPLLQQLDTTLDIVIETRQREGEKLQDMILERCDAVARIVSELRTKLPDIIDSVRDKLLSRAQELKVELEPERLEQELLLLTQKFDVAEELDRLNVHTEEVKRVLNNKEPVGRRLDFLMQEMNREANTLGSKAAHYNYSNASVDLKVFIEQMREQIQNIE